MEGQGSAPTSSSGREDFMNSCMAALKTHLEGILNTKKEGFRPNATIVDDSLLINRVFSRDLASFITVTCKDDRILFNVRYAGALSRAKALGDEAYAAFLEAAMKSGSHDALPGYFYVNPATDVLSFNMIFTQCDISKIMGEYEKYAAGMILEDQLAWIIGLALLLEHIVSSWIERSLEDLEEGEEVEPLDLLKELVEASKEMAQSKGGGG